MALYSQPNDTFTNVNLNALASEFAQDFGHDTNILIQRITNRAIFDAAPKQFFDLKLLNMKQRRKKTSDEFFFIEMDYQREPLQSVAGAAAVVSPASQTFEITSLDNVSRNMIIIYPNNEKGTVTDINESTNEITVKPLTNGTLPLVTTGDIFANQAPVEADGQEGFEQIFRATVTERFNFVQQFSIAMRFGEIEMLKFMQAGTTDS